jgi:SRSO17 transposase
MQCESTNSESRIDAFFDTIGDVLRRKEQRESFALYAVGLMGDGDRKSVEPIASRLSGNPDRADACHQKLLHFLVDSPWSDREVRRIAARHGILAMTEEEEICGWSIDDTGFLKQGRHSVGVQRQYTGSAGKVTNCQTAVSLTVSTFSYHLPIDVSLYLPVSWIEDEERRQLARIPEKLEFRTKPQLAIEMIDRALKDKIPKGVVLADAGYGDVVQFRQDLRQRELDYAVGISANTRVKRLDTLGRCTGGHVTAEDLAKKLEVRRVTWRDGRKHRLTNRFSFERVVPAFGDAAIELAHREEVWLIVEHQDDGGRTKYYFSTLPLKMAKQAVIRMLKERYRTEQVYREFKTQLGLDHYEGRRYTGWNHHVSVALCCFSFLVAEQAQAFSPSRAWRNRVRALSGTA